MITQTARLLASSFRAVRVVFVLALLAGSLSGCLDEPVSVTTSATPRPTRTPKPTATPKPIAAQAGDTKANWTVLVYLDGDNDLEADAIDDYNEMASVGSTDALNIIVQFDRISSNEDWDNTSNGDWKGVKRFRVEHNKRPAKSNQIADLGELNMGSPQTLSDFVTWGIQSYPAQHYALIFWDHGASWPGVASDDSSDGDMLTLPELATALADVQTKTGVGKLDLIGFDACLMGQIDVLQTIAPFGKVAIGSADLEPGEGWAWNAWLGDLAKKPGNDAVALAPSIIKSFTAFYKQEDDPSVTLAAFDLTKVDKMSAQLDTLSTTLINAMPDSFAAIGEARAHAAEYASGDTDISAIDLGYFANLLAAAKIDPQVTSAAKALSQTIKTSRIAQGYGADHPKSTGISIYFPWKKKNYDSSYHKSSPLTEATHWDEFLQAFYKGGSTHSSRSAVSKPEVSDSTVSPAAPLSLSATISGSDTAYVYYFVGAIAPNDPNMVQIFSMDYLYPPGTALNNAIPSWKDGDAVQLSWNASSWYISNGTAVVRAPFSPTDYGSSTYSVEGTYTARKTGKQTPVSVEFAVTQGRGTLQHVWAFDKNNSSNPRPRELKPKAGDTFTPDIPSYNTQSDKDEERTDAGEPIVFGDAPLTAFEGAAPSGEYVIGLMVENVAGDISDQYADVTVDSPNGADLPAIPAPAPAPAAGATAGMLHFHDEQLGFQMDYPENWKPSSPGTDKLTLADSDVAEGALVGVDVYALEGKPSTANRAMLNDVLDSEREYEGFAVRQKVTATQVAGRDAMRMEYVYQDQDGAQFHVVSLAVSDEPTGSIYLITFDAPEETFANDVTVFNHMLESFAID
ncbi:MAG TPA: clostripain-related cysteine peptidase [Roseiflexaceae bacterium]|nr:clostripain-related cysteine peptidase [Roseiflexaceae bacterium]